MAMVEATKQNSLQECAQSLLNDGFHQSVSTEDFMFLKGAEWQSMSSQLREEYIERAFHYWRDRGFPITGLCKSSGKMGHIEDMR